MERERKTTRFKDAAFATESPLTIAIGGVGGIGGPLALSLSRLQHELVIYEMDDYEEANLGTQLVKYSQLGKSKAECIAQMIKEYSDVTPSCLGELTEESFVTPITFSAFDNMKARKIMFNLWKQQEDKLVFIDARMLAENFQILVVNPKDIEKYEKDFLFEDGEVEELPCTYKSTFHVSMIIGGMITAIFTNWLTNHLTREEDRVVPFFTEFSVPNLLFRKS
jgi:hypothetical protein